MIYGYNGKVLEVDLSNGSIKEVRFDEDILKMYIGGRGLATKILWDRLGRRWDSVDPLGEENLLLLLTGPLTGYYPGARICVSGKSPQSNGVIGSTVSSEFPVELRCAGYDGIIVSGRAERPVYISIFNDEIEIRDASHIWGKTGRKTLTILVREWVERYGWKPGRGLLKEPGVVYIGPAGEKLVRTAAVMSKWTHAAGYGGYGAVMGSKNLKAIVAKGTNPLPEAKDMNETEKLIREIWNLHLGFNDLRFRGTSAGFFSVAAARSSEPVRNWQDEWHDRIEASTAYYEAKLWAKRFWGDFGCAIACLKIACIRSGRFKGYVTDNPDYEMQAYLGSNLGIFDPDSVVYICALADELGLCGIQTGNVLGFAAELYQRGILDEREVGFPLRWGDVEAFAKLMRMIAYREGIGDILAEGTYRAARIISAKKGMDTLRYAVQVKGVAVGAHGIRSGLDYTMDTSYACSTQGGDHTSVANIPLRPGRIDVGEAGALFADSAVLCVFNSFSVEGDLVFRLLDSVTGFDITMDGWYDVYAPRILSIQRVLLLIGGPDVYWEVVRDDDNPPRFYEPLPSGFKANAKVDRERFEKLRKEYFESIGWDDRGVPREDTLAKLGLRDVADELRRRGFLG
ncbi:MAG: aldehyde ferredoxin oxidoreductase C-terminal domain-containing protein [Nitrososphaerota archaeon]|nr:aldehyde ferredoxin oxidoreductase C-terminal domain-containing protein [Nitrososphaerota archaeon]